MTNPEGGKRFVFDRPGNYRIRVLGFLDESWSGRLGGLRITAGRVNDPDGPVTELFGKVRDQAALAGLLNSLYELHMPILLVEYQDE